jgi:hypothetical protein
MKLFLLILIIITPNASIFGCYEKFVEKYKPYPSTIDEASDIVISLLKEEHKDILARTYEQKSSVTHHFRPAGFSNKLPINGNQQLISNSDASPKEIYYMIIQQVNEKLRAQLPEEERARIEHFIEFTKRDTRITIAK